MDDGIPHQKMSKRLIPHGLRFKQKKVQEFMAPQSRVSRLKFIPGIGVDRISNAADAAHDLEILRLENLDTDILPPKIAVDVTRNSIDKDSNNSYLPFLGQNELRKAAANHVSSISGINYDWRKQCIISAGGLSGILNCLLAMLEPGDEVIVTDPIYAGLINRIYLAGGVPKFVPLIPSRGGWRLDLEALAKAASEKTRVILMMSPSMPTGHVLDEIEWKAIIEICIKTDSWLLYDAAMERILFDNRKIIHPASLPSMADRTVIVGSASKELRMIGWRIGWIVGPESIINDIGLVSLSNVVCQVGIGMPGVTVALNSNDNGLKNAVDIWERRRNLMLNELKDFSVIPPHGGWSMLMDTTALNMSPVDFSSKLLTHAKIAATPMVGWGEKAANYIRFVFSNEPEERLIGIGSKIKTALKL